MATELRKKLYPYWFTPPDQIPEKAPTRYRVQPPSEQIKAESKLIIAEGGLTQFSVLGFFVHACVTGWENMSEEFDPSLIDQIPETHQAELFAEIINNASMTEDERKNLSSQLRQEQTPGTTAGPAPDHTAQTAQTSDTQDQ